MVICVFFCAVYIRSLFILFVMNHLYQISQCVALGGLSGRFDHVMASLDTMCQNVNSELPLYMVEHNSLVTVIPPVN